MPHSIDIPQCTSLKIVATPVRERPIRDIVGAMVKGPINFRKKPINPVQPSII